MIIKYDNLEIKLSKKSQDALASFAKEVCKKMQKADAPDLKKFWAGCGIFFNGIQPEFEFGRAIDLAHKDFQIFVKID